MHLEIDIEHEEPLYLEERGGYALLTYLRAAAQRAEHRRAAISRAFALFSLAEERGRGGPEAGGLARVLQRALFAAEDL